MESNEEQLNAIQVRRQFNNDLITGDEGREDLPKDLVTKLDKVQKWLGRFKSLAENANEKFFDEIKATNLKKYTSEITESISKTEFIAPKDTDIVNVQFAYEKEIKIIAEICEIMHQRYGDFQKQLVVSFSKQFKAASEIESAEQKTIKRQTLLFLMTELFTIGIILEYKRIFACLQDIISEWKTSDAMLTYCNIVLITSYLSKYQEPILKMVPRSKNSEASESIPQYLKSDQCEAVSKIFVKFFTEIALEFFITQCSKYEDLSEKYEQDMKKIERTNQDEFFSQKEFFLKLIHPIVLLADLLDQDISEVFPESAKVLYS